MNLDKLSKKALVDLVVKRNKVIDELNERLRMDAEDFKKYLDDAKKITTELDKVLLAKELELRTANHSLAIQNQRVDALLACTVSLHIDLRASQTQHVFKPGNESRFEFKNGKWQAKSLEDSLAVAT